MKRGNIFKWTYNLTILSNKNQLNEYKSALPNSHWPTKILQKNKTKMSHLDFALASTSICSWKSTTISWCFLLRMAAVSSDSKCTSSKSLRSFNNSVSRFLLISNWNIKNVGMLL